MSGETIDRRAIEADKSVVDPRNTEADDNASRRESAVKMRIAGASYSDIATFLGYSTPATARRAIERALRDATASPEDREHQRWLLDQRLERLFASVSSKAHKEGPEHLDYAGAALRIIDRKMALWGLSSSNVTITPAPQRVNEVVAELVALTKKGDDQEADILEAEIMSDDDDG